MKALPEKFTKQGVDLELITRNENYGVYRAVAKGSSFSTFEAIAYMKKLTELHESNRETRSAAFYAFRVSPQRAGNKNAL